MSLSSISPVSSPYPFASAASAAASATLELNPAAPSDTVTVDTIPASPPPGVLAEMATAAGAQDRLAAGDRALHFSLDQTTGALSAQVTDLTGSVLRTIAPSDVLDVAAGGSLD
jgi:hypothetical protein